MPTNPNKLSLFWQELKRRNVTRTITVYAAAAFVILELLSIIIEPLRLPDWTLQFAIVFLCIGFIVAVILSWIYDIHPEEGMVKTEPVDKVKKEINLKTSNSWKIASYISFVVIIGLVILNVIPRGMSSETIEILDNSIAVLPFHNDSPDQENDYFINGTMESILSNLCKISDLRVISRSSVEQFRDSSVFIPDVAEYLNVSYILDGSMQKQGDHIRMTIQLIDKNDSHIWSEQYDKEIKDGNTFFNLQSEIAQLVATELHAVITPEEKQVIEQIHTTNLKALSLFQKGREKHMEFWLDRSKMEALREAIVYYRLALEEDPAFGQAYSGLAMAIWNSFGMKNRINREFSENEASLYRDSVLHLVEQALSFDPNLEEAYIVKGDYYFGIQEYEKALEEYERALLINPNYSWAYNAKANVLFYHKNNWISGTANKLKAVELESGEMQAQLLWELGQRYEHMGFNDKAVEVYDQVLLLTGDTTWYYRNLAGPEFCNRNWTEFIYRCKKILEFDPDEKWPLAQISWTHALLGNIDSACHYAAELDKDDILPNMIDHIIDIAYAQMNTGQIDEANRMMNKQADYISKLLDSNEGNIDYHLMSLAEIYALKGQPEVAIEYLKQIDKQIVKPLWFIVILEDGPYLNDIRHREDFQVFLNSLKSVWQAEHNRMRQWLEENDML